MWRKIMGFRSIKRPQVAAFDLPKQDDATVGTPTTVRRKTRGKAKSKAAYPGKVPIRHAVEAARALGVDIGGIEISASGTIRVLDRGMAASQPKDEFEQWLQAGRLA
jgi:hypothetical protein